MPLHIGDEAGIEPSASQSMSAPYFSVQGMPFPVGAIEKKISIPVPNSYSVLWSYCNSTPYRVHRYYSVPFSFR